MTKDSGATQISSGVTSFDPGYSNTTHFHNAEESVIVVEGEGTMVINGEEHQLKLYDGAFITPGTHHRLINNGDGPFRIAWAYATVDVTRTMVKDSQGSLGRVEDFLGDRGTIGPSGEPGVERRLGNHFADLFLGHPSLQGKTNVAT